MRLLLPRSDRAKTAALAAKDGNCSRERSCRRSAVNASTVSDKISRGKNRMEFDAVIRKKLETAFIPVHQARSMFNHAARECFPTSFFSLRGQENHSPAGT
jgi:hypothetical protein